MSDGATLVGDPPMRPGPVVRALSTDYQPVPEWFEITGTGTQFADELSFVPHCKNESEIPYLDMCVELAEPS